LEVGLTQTKTARRIGTLFFRFSQFPNLSAHHLRADPVVEARTAAMCGERSEKLEAAGEGAAAVGM
jgi:hypothetical protein